MKKINLIILIVTYSAVSLFSQEEYVSEDNQVKNYDYAYIDAIKTVQFGLLGMPYSYPIIGLGNGSVLELSFDDLSDEAYDYTYDIVHCNSDWMPSELTEMEYLDGFNNENIRQFEFSRNTLTSYINYSLLIPNQNTKLTKSGNYLLHIYENGDKELPILTRRFMVVNSKMKVIPQLSRTGVVSQARTHQEIDFKILHKGINISNPYNEIKVTVLQNGRWDNAITGVKPLFIKDEELIYDYQGKIVFPAGKEFRNMNIQSLTFRTERVQQIIEDKVDKYHVKLFSDEDRSHSSYLFINDLNGQFIIKNNDRNIVSRIGADYAWVHFSLLADQSYEDAEVYLYGRLTDWQLNDKYKLKYSSINKVYTTKMFLKQGYYDYSYAFVKNTGGKSDTSELDGNWYETENDYQILVYYRPIGTRYDQLVSIGELNSSRR